MKTKSMYEMLCVMLLLMLQLTTRAQAPQAFPYQAIARDMNGHVISNQAVSLRFSIRQGSSSGTILYQEKHTLNTSQLGLCNVNIGQGTLLSGSFASIDWGNGAKYIQVELDPNGGNSFTVMGTTQLLSVPYALYANVPGVAGPQGPQGIPGIAGKTILNGVVNPGSGLGVDGDFYLNTSTKQLFGPKTAGSWGSGTSLIGPQGTAGAQGPQGIPGPAGTNGTNGTHGKTILNGLNNPLASDGTNGDFYLNTSTYELFGPKTGGVWGTGVSLIGAAGGMNNGTAIGNTTFWNGTTWVVNDHFLFNDGTQIGIGNPVPAASSIVDISSNNKGFLMPRLSTAERDAILSPAVGLQVYNLDDHCIDIFDGTVWTKTCGLKTAGTVNDPNHPTPDSWAQKASILNSRDGAMAFTIGNKSYLGLGTFMGMTYYNDFYEYDPATQVWTAKASFPPGARAHAIAFSANGKGYVFGGGNGMFVNYDMWEYDPITDTWTQKTNCPGSARTKAQGFAINNMGYIGLGTDGANNLNDWWEYNPATDTWTAKAAYPGNGKMHTMGFAVNGMGYVGLGTDISGNYHNDVYVYDPGTNSWTAKQVFPGAGFHSMACFTMNNKGYMGTGYDGVADMTGFWEYDAGTDTWTAKAAYGGVARKGAVGFAIGNKGFIATGQSGLAMPLDDVWEYMDNNVTGNAYTNTSINTNNNSINDGAWTVYNNNVYSSTTGNVGIGTTTPGSKLTVIGNVDVSGEILAGGTSGTAGQVLSSNGNGTMSWINQSGGGGGGSSHWTQTGNDIANLNTGNVGIGGMPSASFKLDVSGNAGFTGNLISNFSHKGCISTTSSVGLFTQTLYHLTLDGQNIQASGGVNAFPYNPSARNMYLNPLGGNVGIRTSAANATLTVARGTGGDGTAQFSGTSHASHFNYSTAEDTYIRGGKNGSKVIINDGALGGVIIGNVASTPAGYKLFVQSGILTERLKVAVNGSASWADYVFADDYKLMPLEQVEEYIEAHRHLPNVPSAEEMVNTGIDVATVDAKLMEKIEELTLYLIEMKKELDVLKKKNLETNSTIKN